MYLKSSNITLLTAAGLAIHSVTATSCAIVGPGEAYCREHPNPTASVVKTLSIGEVNNYGCRYPYGTSVDGDR
jgi:hypothetical protein